MDAPIDGRHERRARRRGEGDERRHHVAAAGVLPARGGLVKRRHEGRLVSGQRHLSSGARINATRWRVCSCASSEPTISRPREPVAAVARVVVIGDAASRSRRALASRTLTSWLRANERRIDARVTTTFGRTRRTRAAKDRPPAVVDRVAADISTTGRSSALRRAATDTRRAAAPARVRCTALAVDRTRLARAQTAAHMEASCDRHRAQVRAALAVACTGLVQAETGDTCATLTEPRAALGRVRAPCCTVGPAALRPCGDGPEAEQAQARNCEHRPVESRHGDLRSLPPGGVTKTKP
jgi:hypothetical protein